MQDFHLSCNQIYANSVCVWYSKTFKYAALIGTSCSCKQSYFTQSFYRKVLSQVLTLLMSLKLVTTCSYDFSVSSCCCKQKCLTA